MSHVIRCRKCQRSLSAPLDREVDARSTAQEDAQPFVPEGTFHVSDGEFFTGTAGAHVINLSDRRGMKPHSDSKRLQGCCGLDGSDGANQVCECGAEVATEKSDCWMPHALVFNRDAIEIVEE